MKSAFFKIKCLTNLHVGSGDINFNIVDNEVEKDPVTDYPVIHGSGIKGALRDVAEKNPGMLLNGKTLREVFGEPETKDGKGNSGSYDFTCAHFLARPLRVYGSKDMAYINVTTIQALNDLITSAESFEYPLTKTDCISVNFGEYKFVSNVSGIKIEGEEAKLYDGTDEAFLKSVLGENFAICESFDDCPLPVAARNRIGENNNLWYEEFVPHHSLFWLPVLYPNEQFSIDFPKYFQLGGNASVGCGFVKFEKLGAEV